ncbi:MULTISPECIES: AAA family ATPase [Bacillus cereus group]|uniref:AAA family ATPase n=1 Tax=Bacillus cereus group TaxID=86661 RepID=UPI00034A8C4D|nr:MULTISPECIES: ATP-binding protein [Bacillus cereus group]MCH5448548.1 ATP-binding protein [Bacillus cereus]
MLKKFTVSNYRAFDEPITIDFSNVRDYKFNEECIKGGLINKAIMYGRNAVGKTNLGQALIDIRYTILPNERAQNNDISFLNANSTRKFARFEYTFVIENKEIEYIYEKRSSTELKCESLRINNEILYAFNFESQDGELNNLTNYDELKHLNFEEWDNEITILRYILTNAKLNKLIILKELSNFIEGMAILRPLDNVVQFRGPRVVVDKGVINNIIEAGLVEDFEEFLNDCGLKIKLKVDITPEGEKKLYFDYNRPIDFISNASSGTKALTGIYLIIKNLNKIKFLFIDEFDANFHFELAEKILQKIKTQSDCQILVTTHNTDLMNNKFMRPDCYLLMMPNTIKAIADATLRELRQGHNLEKLYQSGEFN